MVRDADGNLDRQHLFGRPLPDARRFLHRPLRPVAPYDHAERDDFARFRGRPERCADVLHRASFRYTQFGTQPVLSGAPRAADKRMFRFVAALFFVTSTLASAAVTSLFE